MDSEKIAVIGNKDSILVFKAVGCDVFGVSNAEKTRILDELPQSGSGRTITTTEPKFLRKESEHLRLDSFHGADYCCLRHAYGAIHPFL